MKYQYYESTSEDLKQLIKDYTEQLSSPFDSFLEDRIAESVFYGIGCENQAIGYFASHKNVGLTQFYITKQHLSQAQRLFKEVLETYQIKKAYVCTADELFLSLALDQEHLLKKQAYFFQDSGIEIETSKLYSGGLFRTAAAADVPLILEVSGDFFDSLEERVARGEIFVLTEAEELLGAGIIEYGRLLKEYVSIGMFTNEKYRQRGVGTAIITKLKSWCYANSYTPICGCWYYNFNSKSTLEAAGMVTKTRLLSFEFGKQHGDGGDE